MENSIVQDIAFSSDCERVVQQFIQQSEELLGCVAWLTNPAIIEDLARLGSNCRLVVTADVVHNRASLGLHRIARQVGRARGRFRELMHHKFLVRLTNGEPTHVLVGSYNFTRRSNHNIGESVVVLACSRAAQHFADETHRALRASRPIRTYVRRQSTDIQRPGMATYRHGHHHRT